MGVWCPPPPKSATLSASREVLEIVERALACCGREFRIGAGAGPHELDTCVTWLNQRFRWAFAACVKQDPSAWETNSAWLLRKFKKIGRYARYYAKSSEITPGHTELATEEVVRLAHTNAA